MLERAIANLDGAKPARGFSDDYGRPVEVCVLRGGWACNLCAFARGALMPVECWKPAEKVVCLRHLRWIGSAQSSLQPSLDRQPDIVEAHHKHLRLVRRCGREKASAGFEAARHICSQWYRWNENSEEFERRLGVFHGPRSVIPAAHPTIQAAAYPQVVALARLMTSPYWRALAAGASPAGHALFDQELKRTVAPSLRWPPARGSKDPLYRRLVADEVDRARRKAAAQSPSADPNT
jgi:hypothetical protein